MMHPGLLTPLAQNEIAAVTAKRTARAAIDFSDLFMLATVGDGYPCIRPSYLNGSKRVRSGSCHSPVNHPPRVARDQASVTFLGYRPRLPAF